MVVKKMTPDNIAQSTEGTIVDRFDNSGVIKYSDDMFATYFMEDSTVKAIQITAATKVKGSFNNQINHTTNLIKTFKNIAVSLCEVTEDEAKSVMELLGLFDQSFTKGKQVFLFDYLFKVEVVEGLILISIAEL